MRPTVKQALRMMVRARSHLEATETTTVKESMELLQGIHELRVQVMRTGLRAREALRREEERANAAG